jgi:DNA-binding CsgD family transcriptional regulator
MWKRIGAREKEVLFWTSEGKTAEEVATILGISKRTVEWHLRNVRDKTKTTNVVHSIALAVRCGVIGVMGTGICGIGISAAMQSPLLRKIMLDIDVFGVARTIIG